MGSFADSLYSQISTTLMSDGAASATPPPSSTPVAAPSPTPPATPSPSPASPPTSAPSSASPAVAPPPAPGTGTPATPAPGQEAGATPATTPTPAAPPFSFDPEETFEFPTDDALAAQPAAETATESTPTIGHAPGPPSAAPDWSEAAKWLEGMPADVREKFMADPRGRQIYGAYKTFRELEKPVQLDDTGTNVGGLGFRPTIEQIRDMAESHSDLELMAHYFDQAHVNPEYAHDFISNWFGRTENGNPLPGAVAIAQRLLPELDKINPQLYRAVAMPAMTNYIEERYKAIQTATAYPQYADRSLATPEDRLRNLNVTMYLESDLTGQTLQQIAANRQINDAFYGGPIQQFDANGQPIPTQAAAPSPSTQPQPGTDPRLLNELNQLRSQVQNQQQYQAQQAFVAHQSHLDQTIGSNFMRDINAALKPFSDYYGPESIEYRSLVTQFHNDVMRRQGDVDRSPAFRQFIIARDRSYASRAPEDIARAAEVWREINRRAIVEERARYMSSAGQRLIAQSNGRHQVLQEGATKTGIGSTSSPAAPPQAAQSNGSKVVPKPGESYAEANMRTVRELLMQQAA